MFQDTQPRGGDTTEQKGVAQDTLPEAETLS